MIPRSTPLKLGIGTALVAVVGACSPAPMPISRSPEDPSSPMAREGTSPMVLASAPLPQCNMKLVPKK